MGEQPNDQNARISELDRKIEGLQQQVSGLDNASGKALDLLKWGMTIFTTAAVIFSGFNWWSGKSNYDRDRDSLKQQVTLLQEQMAFSQKDLSDANRAAIAAIQSQVDSNATKLNDANGKQVAAMRAEAESNIDQVITQRKTEIVQAIAFLTNYSTVVSNLVQKQLDDNVARTTNLLRTFAETNMWIISNLDTEFHLGASKTQGIGLSVQGDAFLVNNRARSIDEITLLGMGIADMVNAADDWLTVQDDSALRHCLDKIRIALPILITCRAPAQLLPSIDDLTGVGSALDKFAERLEHYENGRYKTEVIWLRLQGTFFKKRVAENREQSITHRER